MLEIQSLVASLFDSNCYVTWDGESKVALVVDPGPGTADRVRKILTEQGLTLGAVLLTHGHADHIWDAEDLSSDQVPVYITGPDEYFFEDPAGLLGVDISPYGVGPWKKPQSLRVIESLSFEPVEGISIRTVPAPGHSPGSALFLVGAAGLGAPLAFSGDVVFSGTVGRTDLPGGDEYEMRQSLRLLSNAIDPATVILPGHGPQTVWQKEINSNPYVLRARKSG